jgi:hypothetical protein
MVAKQAPPKAQKNTAALQKKPPNHQSILEKTVKPPQKKPPSHESTTEKQSEHNLPTQCNHQNHQ